MVGVNKQSVVRMPSPHCIPIALSTLPVSAQVPSPRVFCGCPRGPRFHRGTVPPPTYPEAK